MTTKVRHVIHNKTIRYSYFAFYEFLVCLPLQLANNLRNQKGYEYISPLFKNKKTFDIKKKTFIRVSLIRLFNHRHIACL